jgi:hypothetical protein
LKKAGGNLPEGLYDVIPSSKASRRFAAPKGNSVGDVNELHLELKHLIHLKHGASTRHLSVIIPDRESQPVWF